MKWANRMQTLVACYYDRVTILYNQPKLFTKMFIKMVMHTGTPYVKSKKISYVAKITIW